MSSFPFVLSFLISLWVHFVIISLFAIKPLSTNIFMHFSPKMTFLGSAEGINTHNTEINPSVPVIKLPERTGALETIQALARESIESFGELKDGIKPFSGVNNPPDRTEALFPTSNVSRKYLVNSREALEREGLNKPVFEVAHRITYPEWAKKRGIESELKLLFRVTPEGFVDQVEVDRLSGYPELDVLGVKEVYQWRFNPLENKDAPAEWGEVVVKFVLD